MSHIVLAVGATAVCLSGSAWYLPAVADLRAGDDRPRSRRLGALACVTTWAAAAVAGLLLFAPVHWQAPGAVAGGGAAAGILLRSLARAQRARERRETERCWSALPPALPAARSRGPRRVLVAWTLLALAAAPVLTALRGPFG
ncbi:hypothetical protein [Streptomyces nondiastaticus]|uniref:Uncharacterized protein n=1 Tax=Streptomyces nondiastaticus TaxID=3154512 RepID=A0ABW6U0A1_9ACTN